MLEEGVKYIRGLGKNVKLENNDLISKLAKTEQNIEKYRKKIIHLSTEVKYLRVNWLTVTSETNQLNMPTNYAVGNDLWKDFHEFTQQLWGIDTNLQALTSLVETVELHAVENAG